METIQQKVILIIREVIKSESVDEFSKIGLPYQWDSLNHIHIILQIESRFDLTIGASNVAHLTSVAAIIRFLAEQGNK